MSSVASFQGRRALWQAALCCVVLLSQTAAASRASIRFNASGTERHKDGADLLTGLEHLGSKMVSHMYGVYHGLQELGGSLLGSSEMAEEQRERARRMMLIREDLKQLGALEEEATRLRLARALQAREGQAPARQQPHTASGVFDPEEAIYGNGAMGLEGTLALGGGRSREMDPEKVMYLLAHAGEDARDVEARLEALRSLREKERQRSLAGDRGFWQNVVEILLDVGGGTGATISGSGDTFLDQVLLRRMRYQDKAVMLLLLLAYMGALLFSGSLAYRQANNSSPVTYYADPRYQNAVMDGQDPGHFLSAFTRAPKDVQLQVIGLMPLPPLPDFVMESAVEWLGSRYRVDFAFSLDLTPWLVRQPCSPGEGDTPGNTPRTLAEEDADAVGVYPEDVFNLEEFLEKNTNDLACVEVHKQVEWKGWEELATNVKSKIRQSGYSGIIHVRHTTEETITVYKNKQWANFLHSRTTKVLCALSVVGWLIYQPYMWIRHRSQVLRCKYRVDCTIDQYWALIWDKLGPQGFISPVAGAVPPQRGPANQRWSRERL